MTAAPEQGGIGAAWAAFLFGAGAFFGGLGKWLISKSKKNTLPGESNSGELVQLRHDVTRRLDILELKIGLARTEHGDLAVAFQELKVTIDSINSNLMTEILGLRRDAAASRALTAQMAEMLAAQAVVVRDLRRQIEELKTA
jgi:hypothetical protein